MKHLFKFKSVGFIAICTYLLLWSTPLSADNPNNTDLLGTKIELTTDYNHDSPKFPHSPIRIPTLLSIDHHTLYAYPANVGGTLMQITLTDNADNTVATYTAAGLDVVKFNLPTELSGNYDVEVRVNDK